MRWVIYPASAPRACYAVNRAGRNMYVKIVFIVFGHKILLLIVYRQTAVSLYFVLEITILFVEFIGSCHRTAIRRQIVDSDAVIFTETLVNTALTVRTEPVRIYFCFANSSKPSSRLYPTSFYSTRTCSFFVHTYAAYAKPTNEQTYPITGYYRGKIFRSKTRLIPRP